MIGRNIRFCIALGLSMILLTACGGNAGEDKQPERKLYPSKAVTLRFYFGGEQRSASKEVWSVIGDYVQTQGLNVKFDVHYIPFGDFRHKMLAMSAAGDKWDMNIDTEWLAYKQMVAKGAYMPLNELLPQYAPNLYRQHVQQGSLQAATVYGNIVSIPWTMKMNDRQYASWRSDMTRKAGINPEKNSIQTIEQLDDFLHQMKQAYPNEKLSRTIPLAIYMQREEWIDLEIGDLGFYLSDPNITVRALEQQPFFKEAVAMAKRWNESGILNEDAIIDKEDGATLWRAGKTLFTTQSHEWVFANQGFNSPEFEHESSLLYPDSRAVNRSPLANVVAINRNSEHPELVLRFLDMLFSDRKLYDLVHYGLEGVTYVLDGETAAYPEGMNTLTSNYMEWGGHWALWNLNYMRPGPTYGADFWLKEAEFAGGPMNMPSPVEGLYLTDDAIKEELRRRNYTGGQLHKMIFGIVDDDIDKAVEELIAQQKANGLDTIIAEAQRQVDAFLGSHSR